MLMPSGFAGESLMRHDLTLAWRRKADIDRSGPATLRQPELRPIEHL
jgi:hypothetical protein